ncbi:aerial mycelium formation protein [Streptomyces sodiiphilus]|uniref:Aerial mycelium formation protein n=1 Tax=Streptomyces sodiiphilus TaxID=226217 RepID=A0ABN2PV10_9ACTN
MMTSDTGPRGTVPSASGTGEVPEGLRRLGLAQLRARYRTAQREEADLSYVRRLLQGRVDILRAEQRRRSGPETGVLASLPQILADGPARQRSARHVRLGTPAGEEYRRLVEEMLAEISLSDLSTLTDHELRAALARLTACEAEVSRRRRAVHRTADSCGAEITRRYREGEAQVDDLLT